MCLPRLPTKMVFRASHRDSADCREIRHIWEEGEHPSPPLLTVFQAIGRVSNPPLQIGDKGKVK